MSECGAISELPGFTSICGRSDITDFYASLSPRYGARRTEVRRIRIFGDGWPASVEFTTSRL